MGGRSSGSGFKAGAPAAAAASGAAASAQQQRQQQQPQARMTNAQRALRSATWSNDARGGRLTVPGVGRAEANELSHPILGDRTEANIYDPSGNLINSRMFSGAHQARSWAWNELDRRASRMP